MSKSKELPGIGEGNDGPDSPNRLKLPKENHNPQNDKQKTCGLPEDIGTNPLLNHVSQNNSQQGNNG